ncbi:MULTISPECIES: hypothetical protein [Microbacterium]|uniref:hypothetical protein n=1 Tax=Microbacterium TaxID=33882 RepID=UPI00146F8731|nr:MULTISPECIES: hypothetical protein [Microbacterium]
MNATDVVLRPIGADDAAAVCAFLHAQLNRRIPVHRWSALFAPPWSTDAANHGFLIEASGRIVGAYVAVYADRVLAGAAARVCNLAAFCVLEEYRPHSLRLVRAVLGQPGLVFTDLSPSGNVIALNERLGFDHLDTATSLALNLPRVAPRGIRISSDPMVAEATVTGEDVRLLRDHRGARAVRHLTIRSGESSAYLMVRKVRRKGLPVFATVLHAGGDRALLVRAWRAVGAHLLVHHGAVATLVERRVLPEVFGRGRVLARPRPKMFRAKDVPAAEIDDLYSELVLLEW